MPEAYPARYTTSPTSMNSGSTEAPAASRMRRVWAMISGPMPSPAATAMRTFEDTGEKVGGEYRLAGGRLPDKTSKHLL